MRAHFAGRCAGISQDITECASRPAHLTNREAISSAPLPCEHLNLSDPVVLLPSCIRLSIWPRQCHVVKGSYRIALKRAQPQVINCGEHLPAMTTPTELRFELYSRVTQRWSVFTSLASLISTANNSPLPSAELRGAARRNVRFAYGQRR